MDLNNLTDKLYSISLIQRKKVWACIPTGYKLIDMEICRKKRVTKKGLKVNSVHITIIYEKLDTGSKFRAVIKGAKYNDNETMEYV